MYKYAVLHSLVKLAEEKSKDNKSNSKDTSKKDNKNDYDFFFADNEGRHKLLSGYMFGYRRGNTKDFPNTDFVINLTLKIQKILQDNGINVEMWDNKRYVDD